MGKRFAEYYLKTKDREESLHEIGEAIKVVEKYKLPTWEYYLFRTRLLYKMKKWDDAANDILKCTENLDRILKNIPEEHRDVFANRSEVREAQTLMEKLSESLK